MTPAETPDTTDGDSTKSGSGLDIPDEVLGEYFEALEAQREHARSRILEKYSEFRPQLESFFENYDAIDARTEALRKRAGALDLIGQSLGSYEIREVVGYGAMGVVYEAWQERPSRRVALKVLPRELLPGGESRAERFLREGQLAGDLAHPAICPIYEIGEALGYQFIAMQFVEGQTLADRIAASRKIGRRCCVVSPDPYLEVYEESRSLDRELLPRPDERAPGDIIDLLNFFMKLCRALHVTHEKKVIHRDIKPGNIMVRDDGDPVLLDFGLARTESVDASSLTESGAVVGTLAYMSPEQVQARSDVDRRSDVYSLGVTLFECLTLRKPFEAPIRHELYQCILHSEAPDCRRINRHIPKDLKVVVEKAIDKDPGRRYRSARELAEELRRVVEHEPVKARSAGPLLRWNRWMKRHPARATLQLSVLVALIAALIFIRTLYLQQEKLERTHVEGLAVASSEGFPETIRQLQEEGIFSGLEPYLREDIQQYVDDSKEKLHLALALSILDPSWTRYLRGRIRTGTPDELRAISAVAAANGLPLRPWLEESVRKLDEAPAVRLRCFAVLSALVPDGELSEWTADLSTWLREEPTHLAEAWLRFLRDDVRDALAGHLQQLVSGQLPQIDDRDREFADWALVVLSDDDPDFLLELLVRSDGSALRTAVEELEGLGEDALRGLRKRFTGTIPWGPEALKDELAREQANLAAALIRIEPERSERAWELFGDSPDPRIRSYLIPRLASVGVPPAVVARRALADSGEPLRHGLILSLGDYSPTSFSTDFRAWLIHELERVSREDPDPGVHSASLWTIQSLEGKQVAANIESSIARQAANVDASDGSAGKRWRYGPDRHCLAEIEGRPDFTMGPGRDEEGRTRLEVSRPGRLPRKYLISTREVTWSRFRPFYEARHEEWEEWNRAQQNKPGGSPKGHSLEWARNRWHTAFKNKLDPGRTPCSLPDCPARIPSWYTAVFYCQWLSGQDGLDDDDCCYEIREVKPGAYDWALKEDYLSKTGYRLPTAAEWEYACRAGSTTRRFYGNADELLSDYAWYRGNSPAKARPGALLKPNAFGLFDMLGNLAEFCEADPAEVESILRRRRPRLFQEKKLGEYHHFTSPYFYDETRGASTSEDAQFVRSAYFEFTALSDNYLTFRVARTLLP